MKIVYLFWTDQCHRCRLFQPEFESWAQKYPSADFVSVPLDDPEIARNLGITSVPTVAVVEGQKVLAVIRRVTTEQEIARLLEVSDEPGEMDITEARTGEVEG